MTGSNAVCKTIFKLRCYIMGTIINRTDNGPRRAGRDMQAQAAGATGNGSSTYKRPGHNMLQLFTTGHYVRGASRGAASVKQSAPTGTKVSHFILFYLQEEKK